MKIKASDFGSDFYWGIAMAAQQNEGARNKHGRSDSIWDTFAAQKGKIKNNELIGDACDFYHRYEEDIILTKKLGFNTFRFSISWSRILPDISGKINQSGLTFYHNVIDACLKNGLIPFVTIYHWDLPQCLEDKGGWTSPLMPLWFGHYVRTCARAFGDKVKHWIVLNEPMGFTTLGYLLGKHAPGKRSLKGYFSAIHNALMAQGIGGRELRDLVPNAYIGTTFSCSEIRPFKNEIQDIEAAQRTDLLMNRLFIEPLLGLGYPQLPHFPLLEKMEVYNLAWRYRNEMRFDFDFIGLQNYFPITVKYNALIPYLHATEVSAVARKQPHTALGWEVDAQGFGNIVRQFSSYKNIPELFISENGAAFRDKVDANGQIQDDKRVNYFKEHLSELLRLKKEGMPIKGYMAWTLVDNFEWAFGYSARFGLVAMESNTLNRVIKKSGFWFQSFLHS